MPSASKNKGALFEREIAKFLSDLYGCSFIRAPGSGAYTGGSNSHRRKVLSDGQVRGFKGDIVPPEDFPLFNAEAKFYADFAFHQLFTESIQLESWLNQLMTAGDPGDLNMLFMKFNRRGRFVAVQANPRWSTECSYFTYTSAKYGDWMIYSFDIFFKLNSTLVKTLAQTPLTPSPTTLRSN